MARSLRKSWEFSLVRLQVLAHALKSNRRPHLRQILSPNLNTLIQAKTPISVMSALVSINVPKWLTDGPKIKPNTIPGAV